MLSSPSACSRFGRPVMGISDQAGQDSYQVSDGTRTEVVLMMATDSGSEVHTAPVTFPWNLAHFDATTICLADAQGNKLKLSLARPSRIMAYTTSTAKSSGLARAV